LNYYTGQYTVGCGNIDSTDYNQALKLSFQDEAERFCEWVNRGESNPYRVEEHMYSDTRDAFDKMIDELKRQYGFTDAEILDGINELIAKRI
jgi:hypothetical protein